MGSDSQNVHVTRLLAETLLNGSTTTNTLTLIKEEIVTRNNIHIIK